MKYPIGLSIILNALAAISILSGCSDYLDREYDSFIDNEMTFTSYERTSTFLVNAYRYLPDGFNRIGSEAMLDAATDDAEHANASCNIQHFNTGAWNSRSNPDDLWNKYYAGIRIANEFIENVDRVNLDKYRLDPDNQNEYQNRLNDLKTWKYEARFLRAFFHFELVKRFGPVPVITSTLSVNADYSETPRPSMDDCISFISSECDKVAEVLDLTPGRGIDSDLGRATKGAALALKSRVLLYAASPLYLDWQNLSESDLPSDMEKWKAAAQAAKDVIDLGIYSLYGSYATLFKNNFQNSEFILMRRYGNSSDFEKYNFPVSYGGVGGINPSLNLVDSYEMKDGSYFSWENEENAVRPQFYRDDRLNATILLNDSVWKSTAVENWDGGKDGLGVTNATKTGFYLKKYLNEDVNIQTGGGSQGHIWPLFRLAEIYLNYAEALNEYDPENADIAEYVNRVRSRAGQPNLPSGLTQDEMRERIRRERRVELAFEEHRSWDVRRWKIAQETLGGDLLGLEITRKNQARRAVTRNSVIPANEVPEGWHYYDGDEFNDLVINNSCWGQYGSDTPVGNSQYGQPTGNIQTYRKKQITIEKGSGGLSFARIAATKDDNPPAPTLSTASTREGWWSGALSSRDTDKYGYQGKYYPLHSRIEIRAKIPYIYGIWMGPWCRHYAGASVAELDIEEFFVKEFENTASPRRLSQALHLHDNKTGNLGINVNGYGRHTVLDFDPGADFHTYGVQVDPDPVSPDKHAIISYLLDGKVTNTFKTIDYDDRYNTFITKAIAEGREKRTWDIAITGQIGGKNENGIGYPEDRNANLRNVSMDVDWVRVFTRDETEPEIPEKPEYPVEKFDYSRAVVEKRVFDSKMYWYPIPESEILQLKNWKQNPGW